MSSPDVRVIAVTSIRENPVALRAVDRESEEFIGLRDSIAEKGILNPISVRERREVLPDGAGTQSYFEIIDGLHRYTAGIEAGLEEFPVLVCDLSDSETLEAQILANVHKIETRPVEYTKQLQRILAQNPTMTLSDLASKLAKSPSWIQQRLGLLKLEPSIQQLVDDSKIKLYNAYVLAKLPHEEQIHFVDQAMTMTPGEFAPTVQARAKELKDAQRQGRVATAVGVFIAVPKLRKMADLKLELESGVFGPQLLAREQITEPLAGFQMGVKFAMCLDPVSIVIAKEKFDTQKKAVEEARAKRKAEREAKRVAEAATAKANVEAQGLPFLPT